MFKELKDLKLKIEEISKITNSTTKNNDRNYKEITVLKEKKDKAYGQIKQDFYIQMLKLQKELDDQKQLSKNREVAFNFLNNL